MAENGKKRIIRDFNFLYDNVYGEILRNGYEDISGGYRIGYKLHKTTSVQEIQEAIKKSYAFHDNIGSHRDNYIFKASYKDSKPLFEIIRMPYTDGLDPLQKKTACIDRQYIVLTGSAGNGKTNLLCSIVQLLLNLKQPVLFVNAKDMKGNLSDYILNELKIPEALKTFVDSLED